MSNSTINALAADLTKKNELLNLIYPIGSIYISTQNVDPSILFGGEWQPVAQGRCLMGAGSLIGNNNSDYGGMSDGLYSLQLGDRIGQRRVTLTTEQIPKHAHSSYILGVGGFTDDGFKVSSAAQHYGNTTGRFTSFSTGGGSWHNNMPPALVVNMYERIS